MTDVNIAPAPFGDPIANQTREVYRQRKQRDPLAGLVGAAWLDFFTNLNVVLGATGVSVNTVQLADESAAIGATDMSDGSLAAGLYEVSYSARIVQAATVSSSLTVTLNWTDRSTSMSFSGAAMTGNAITTFQSETLLIRVDASSPVRYSTAYSSVGATAMEYDISIVLSRVGA